ncbi:MAG: hypothetical protein SGBAC_003992 [Bacillariaceae sp.]
MVSKRKLDAVDGEKDTKKPKRSSLTSSKDNASSNKLPFDHKYIVAPMVGASELPFRLLCRKYGAQLVYTPMMIADQFAQSKEYREREFQTCSFDRPLVCHFAANDPKTFAMAAKKAEPYCDAIDLNLGCPQRTAYVGHFGSYLLDSKDRDLVMSIVQAGAAAVKIPIFVKIRLLDTFDDTAGLCRQLYEAGASLIAIHARYRANFSRKGPGARDGPALLDQVKKLTEMFPNKVVVTNGNTITYDDVENNLAMTKADGIMSAEGILDNPALYLGRLGDRDSDMSVAVKGGSVYNAWPEKQQLVQKLRKIRKLQSKAASGKALSSKEQTKIAKEAKVRSKIRKMNDQIVQKTGPLATATTTLADLYQKSDDKVNLALEYLQIVHQYPATLRTIIFHTRRILKVELATFQLMEECLGCNSLDKVEALVLKIRAYQQDPATFTFDVQKARAEKEALARKKTEEGKRKSYEARMMRKAKREGKKDLEFYLRQGAAVPTCKTIQELKRLTKEEQMKLWKEREHSQHCLIFHLNGGECHRGRGCAFLHVATKTDTTFNETDEVAG